MKTKVLYFLLSAMLIVLFSCSEDSTGPDNDNPTENWDIIIDDGAGSGSWELELMPDSTIISSGSWVADYGERVEISCNFISSPIDFNGQQFSFTADGTAHHSGLNQDSDFTITVSGSMYNGIGSGVYQIEYTQIGWESGSGTWSGSLNSGDGVTPIGPEDTILEINVYLQPFLNYNLNVNEVSIKIVRGDFADSTNAIINDSIATTQFISIDAGVYYIYYDIYVDSILTVSDLKDGVVEPNVTNLVSISENDWEEIPPTVLINFGDGFEYKEDMEYYTMVYDINSPFTIEYTINENGHNLFRSNFYQEDINGNYIYWWWDYEYIPDFFQNYLENGFGRYKFYLEIEYDTSNSLISNELYSYGYMDFYESPLINGNTYSFKINPNKEIFSNIWNINPLNIENIYIAGDFNNWIWNSEEYKMIQNGEFYEISLSNIVSNQQYKFVIKHNNGNENWVPDVVNYRMTDDGYGGYNSKTP